MAEHTCTIGVAFGGQPGDGRIRTLHACGAEIVDGPCEQFRRVYRLCERDCGLMLAEHDSSQHHDYDGYICTNGHPQEAPSE